MKLHVVLVALILGLSPLSFKKKPAGENKQAKIDFKETTKDVGKINQGTPYTIEYEFKNTGNSNLIITAVSPGCGCTTGDYSHDAIAPGKKGFIKLVYNAAAAGSFTKSATVTSNATEGTVILYFKGEVVPQQSGS